MGRIRAVTVLILLCLGASAHAIEIGAEYFLVNKKNMGTVQFTGRVQPRLDLSGHLGLVFSEDDETEQGAAGSFLGSTFDLHLLYRIPVQRGTHLRTGGGFDVYPLFGIHGEEVHGGLVSVVDIISQISPGFYGFLRARYYLVHNEGFQPGNSQDGNSGSPLVWSAGLSWRF